MKTKKKKIKPYHAMSLLDFQRKFPREKECWNYLVKMRWPEGFLCPACKGNKSCLNPKRKVFECYECHTQTSVMAGTVFHKSRIPLHKWFWAIFLMSSSKKGISMLYLQKQLGIKSYRAVWLMGQKIRKAMTDRDSLYKIGNLAQVDEIFIGGKQARKNRKKNGTNKTPFLIAVEETKGGKPRFVALTELANTSPGPIQTALEKKVRKGAKLKSDGHVAYKEAHQSRDYEVEQVVQSTNPEKAAEHLKWANMLTSNLKRFLLSTYHGVHPHYRAAYIAEFAYRFNRRYWPHQAFDRLLYACLNASPVTLPELRA